MVRRKIPSSILYVLHFQRKVAGKVLHYLGRTSNLDARMERHRTGQGAAICRQAVKEGIGWWVHELGPGGWEEEQKLKIVGHHERLCPLCHGVSIKMFIEPGVLNSEQSDYEEDPF